MYSNLLFTSLFVAFMIQNFMTPKNCLISGGQLPTEKWPGRPVPLDFAKKKKAPRQLYISHNPEALAFGVKDLSREGLPSFLDDLL